MKKILLVLLAVAVIASTVVLPTFAADAAVRDFDSATDSMSYDQILIDGVEAANGNEAVIALKAKIDSSTKFTNTVTMFGWFGSTEAAVKSYGYQIDDGEFVWGDFKAETEQAVYDAGGDSRYMINVDVSELLDGAEHLVRGAALLENGTIVIMNRFPEGKDRRAQFNYVAPSVLVARDELCLDNVGDVALVGGNPFVSCLSLTDADGLNLEVWGWVGTTTAIQDFGYILDGGEYVTQASYTYVAEQGVLDAVAEGVGADANASRFDIYVPLTKGIHTIEACVNDGNNKSVFWKVLVAVDTAVTADAFETREHSPAVWLGNGTNTPLQVEFTTTTAFKAVTFPQYWAGTGARVPNVVITATDDDGNVYTASASVNGDSGNGGSFTFDNEVPAGHYTMVIDVENKLPAESAGYFVLASATSDEALVSFEGASFAFGLEFATPAETYFVENPVPVAPTADASLVIFVLAAAAIALVVLKKKAF